MANNATNVPLATSVSAAAADLTLTPSGSFTATASRPPHSLQSKQHGCSLKTNGCSLKTIRRHLAKAVTKAPKRWYEQYAAFLNERSVNEKTGHSHYTNKRLRTAYHSLKRHLPWLFTFEDFPALSIPNTTNLLEGKFGDMKRLLKCHHGLKKANKILFINDYFAKG